MAVTSNLSPTFRTKTYRSDGNTLRNSTNYKFRVQSAPPLSLQQFARSAAAPIGAEKWQPSGAYHEPTFHAYLSPEIRTKPAKPPVQPWIYAYRRKNSIPTYTLKNYKDPKPKPSEPTWHPPGRYVHKPTTSLSPERRKQKPIHEPVWQPPGKTQYEPVPYFDPPNLRWSLRELIKSTPRLQTKTLRTSRSVSVMNS
ncbi:unnamed protein product [Rotaria sordida]|uniref:Uncharacterized protein n=1 Tax=Rotaria sordida TaxID=392033 RepID=A0A818Y0Z0_9BILA|nr:unnamed protein product [Rotaria sordida]CAF1243037.1 unnamed protein product [Rotaria sordida]CAF1429498.1 unnamed protein product [Rotaria sordida]CAF3747981.1 unnamed protein product [Rotaria sordida]